jgi:hypothetical protein
MQIVQWGNVKVYYNVFLGQRPCVLPAQGIALVRENFSPFGTANG